MQSCNTAGWKSALRLQSEEGECAAVVPAAACGGKCAYRRPRTAFLNGTAAGEPALNQHRQRAVDARAWNGSMVVRQPDCGQGQHLKADTAPAAVSKRP